MIKDPLVTKERTSLGDTLRLVVKLTNNPVLASFIHPVYQIVNAAVLGHSQNASELAGLGLGSLTLGLCIISITSTFVSGEATLVAQAYGDKKYELCLIYRHKQVYLMTILYLVLSIPLVFVEKIYELIGQDPATAKFAT